MLSTNDTMFYLMRNNLIEMIKHINDLDCLCKYLCDNNMVVSSSYDDNVIIITEIKYLIGVVIDKTLKSYEQNLQKEKNITLQSSFNLSIYTKFLFYKSLTEMHLNFCSTALYILPGYRVKDFRKVQNRCMKSSLKRSSLTSKDNYSNLMSVQQKLYCNALIFSF